MALTQAERSAEFRRRREQELAHLKAEAGGRDSALSGKHFVRAAFAQAQAKVRHRDPEAFYGDDPVAPIIIARANQTIGTTTVSGWASQLAESAWGEFLLSLSPYGAAARLISQATRASVGPEYATNYPVRAAGPTLPAWIAEGGAIPVRSAVLSTVAVGPPKKMAHLLVWSVELGKRSDAERIFAGMLREDIALGLDAAFLATTAGNATQPAGLLFGATLIPAHPGGDQVAAETDLAALASVVSLGGSGNVTFIVSPERLARLNVTAPLLRSNADVVASQAVPTDRIVAIDGAALIVAVGDEPDILRSEEAVVHMSDIPLELVADNTTIADPQRSLYQTGGVAIRVIHELDFTKRRASAAAYVDGASW